MPPIPEGLGREELLALLRPPYPNGLFPLAVGWKIMIASVSAFAVAVFLYRNGSVARRRRKAFALLDALEERFRKDSDVSALASGISVLMKRAASVRFGRESATALSGEAWTAFLKTKGAELSERDEELLRLQAYAPACRDEAAKADAERLIQTARKWMRHVL